MKIKKVRNMSIQKQKKMLANKMKLLKWTKLIRNISLVETVLLSPLYFSMLQDCFHNQFNSLAIFKTAFLMALTVGLTGAFQGMSEKTIANCATLETLIDLKKIEKESLIENSFPCEEELERPVSILAEEPTFEMEGSIPQHLIRDRHNI